MTVTAPLNCAPLFFFLIVSPVPALPVEVDPLSSFPSLSGLEHGGYRCLTPRAKVSFFLILFPAPFVQGATTRASRLAEFLQYFFFSHRSRPCFLSSRGFLGVDQAVPFLPFPQFFTLFSMLFQDKMLCLDCMPLRFFHLFFFSAGQALICNV